MLTLKQELREPATYNVIIESIASGASRLNEIATKSNLESNKCAKYLNSLISLGLISKEYPYGEAGSKRSIYKIEDNMCKQWFFALAGKHATNESKPAFERDALPFFIGNIGRWWGTNSKTRK